jgi:2-iminobutanoate/2-iminopropanoate deaminase
VWQLLRVSGIPVDDARGRLALGDFGAQMREVLANVTGILKEAGTASPGSTCSSRGASISRR